MSKSVDAFFAAVSAQDVQRADTELLADPRIADTNVHVAAVLGNEEAVRRFVSADPASVHRRAGSPGAPPLTWLCFSPYHGESPERDDALASTARTLLDAGADPNAKDDEYGLPALYAVTGVQNVPRIARMLLEAGASPDDGESVFHAAERYHLEALELLREFRVDLNRTGEWGNTPLYFLLRYWDVEQMPRVRQGMLWLLANGADPNVRCAPEQETSLHVAIRRRQSPSIVRLLLDHGADPVAQRGDGRRPWILAQRGASDSVARMLEDAGAPPEELSNEDMLLRACASGDAPAAAHLATPELLDSLGTADRALLVEAARRGDTAAVNACLTAGFDGNTLDENGATALHHASIEAHTSVVDVLLRHGADFGIRDGEHRSTPLGWACFGADYHRGARDGYEECVRVLLRAGARLADGDYRPAHEGVAAALREFDEEHSG